MGDLHRPASRRLARTFRRVLVSLVFASMAIAVPLLVSTPRAAWAASQDDARPPGEYAGSEACSACHESSVTSFAHTTHARVLNDKNARTAFEARACEACHGPAKAHVDAGGGRGAGNLVTFRRETPEAARREDATCLTCHQKGQRIHWASGPHASPDNGCTSCHTVMTKVSDRALLAKPTQLETCGSCHIIRRAQQFRNGHMPLREGKMACTSCHAPHGSPQASLLKGDSPNGLCFSCHADKRGPFLWEHAPVVESCQNCHDPHGTPREAMLKVAPPRLCQACHIETRHPTEGRQPGNKFVIGRACLSCHIQVHGSNHPSGFAFTR